MGLEDTLASWTAPSSDTEQEKQDRTERMIREALGKHPALKDCKYRVFAKGSYANNTNVRADSDVDIAVECTEASYWNQSKPGFYTPTSTYEGPWSPAAFRTEVEKALAAAFPAQVDTTGSTAIQVHATSARVDADVVPCFSYRYYYAEGKSRLGTKLFKRDGSRVVNYPEQQLEHGTAKNKRTSTAYKKAVRILKRTENVLATKGLHAPLPSYFVECLAYNCPDSAFNQDTWTGITRDCLLHIWTSLDGAEPSAPEARWLEANNCLYLFTTSQKWTRDTGRSFAAAAWKHLELK